MTQPVWRRSSRSVNGQDCVEVAGSLSALRDSKNPAGPRLAADVRSLIQVIKTGSPQRAR